MAVPEGARVVPAAVPTAVSTAVPSIDARLVRVAFAALVVLVLASLALPFVGADAPSGLALAAVKVAVLVFVATRVVRRDVYALQWSSMLIQLFFIEAIVRATSDRGASAALGAVATLACVVYFVAVLAGLRPLKKAARAVR